LLYFVTCQEQQVLSPDIYEKYDNMITSPPMFDENEVNEVSQKSNQREGNINHNLNPEANRFMQTQEFNPNSSILQPPQQRSKIITNAQGQQEELIYVPTPVDEETYKKMSSNPNLTNLAGLENSSGWKGMSGNQLQMQMPPEFENEKNLSGSDYGLSQDKFLFPTDMNLNLNITSQNPNSTEDQLTRSMIGSQEKDYNKYFEQLNKIEYDKIFNKLKPDNQNKINEEMFKSDDNIDYAKIMAQNAEVEVLLNKSLTVNANQQIKNLPMIDLPQDRIQFEKLVSKLNSENK